MIVYLLYLTVKNNIQSLGKSKFQLGSYRTGKYLRKKGKGNRYNIICINVTVGWCYDKLFRIQ